MKSQTKPKNIKMSNNTIITTDAADEVLKDRQGDYGVFINNATISQDLKNTLAKAVCLREDVLPPDVAECMDMFCSKMSRIVCGSPKGWRDQFLDIEGYARLVRERMDGNAR
jgi:hypothetical protein